MIEKILEMSDKELMAFSIEETKKQKFEFMSLEDNSIPEDVKIAFKYISDRIVKEDCYNNERYNIALIEEYIPMMGMIWRCIIYDRLIAERKLYEVGSKALDNLNVKKVLGGTQLVSIYYDNSDVLGIMERPYFEIYGGHDIERYYGHEYKKLYNNVVEILRRKK